MTVIAEIQKKQRELYDFVQNHLPTGSIILWRKTNSIREELGVIHSFGNYGGVFSIRVTDIHGMGSVDIRLHEILRAAP